MPPEKKADFVAHMEDGLALSQHPDASKYPVINMDDKPLQLIKETRQPLPARPGKPWRYAYASERVGTANVCLCTEPLTGWRSVDGSAQRTGVDGAHQVQHLRDDHYPQADQVRVVGDNRNTHTIASLYEACAPADARRLARRLA